MSGQKIIDGLKAAIAGDFSAVTVEGQRWVLEDVCRNKVLEEAATIADELARQYAAPVGDKYTCGLWDQSHRIRAAILDRRR